MENIFPFLFLGAVYSLLDPSPTVARIHFLIFCVGRIIHTIAYLLRLRAPTRSVAYSVAQLPCFSMALQILLATTPYWSSRCSWAAAGSSPSRIDPQQDVKSHCRAWSALGLLERIPFPYTHLSCRGTSFPGGSSPRIPPTPEHWTRLFLICLHHSMDLSSSRPSRGGIWTKIPPWAALL
ncbi:prostaglandin E synthase isoform 3-T6 [Acridotheres tristis]